MPDDRFLTADSVDSIKNVSFEVSQVFGFRLMGEKSDPSLGAKTVNNKKNIKPIRRIVLALTLTLLVACGETPGGKDKEEPRKNIVSAPKKQPKPAGLPVKAERVSVGEVTDRVAAVGTLLAEESVIIRPEIDGRIILLHFEEGQSVKTGQKLVTIDSAEYRAQLNAVKADLRTEQQKFDRLQELFEKKFISIEALEIQQGAVERLAARVEEAQSIVDKTVIKAPFPGLLGLREVSPGAYIKAGADIVRLENLSSVKADFRIPEIYDREY